MIFRITKYPIVCKVMPADQQRVADRIGKKRMNEARD